MKKRQAVSSLVFATLMATGVGAGYMYSSAQRPALAATNYPLRKMYIELNGQLVTQPMGIYAIDPNSNNYTTYMPIWYVMYALQQWGITSQWNGSNWNLVLPSNLQGNFNPNNVNSDTGNGPVSVSIDNTFIEHTQKIVNPDPYSNENTTYVPIWYVGQILSFIGVNYTWNGSVWNMMLSNASIVNENGSNPLNGLTNALNNGAGQLSNALGSLGNSLSNGLNSNSLSNGLNSLSNSLSSASSGSNPLSNGLNSLSNSLSSASSGSNPLSSGLSSLSNSLSGSSSAVTSSTSASGSANPLSSGLSSLSNSLSSAGGGSNPLSNGLDSLSNSLSSAGSGSNPLSNLLG